MKTAKLKVRVSDDGTQTFITWANTHAQTRWWDGYRMPATVAIYGIPDEKTPIQIIKAFESTVDLSWLGGKDGREKYFWEEMGTIIKNPFPKMYMNKATGSVAQYEDWYDTDKKGVLINYVDLGQVVEVKYDNDSWVEI